jgi:hypothetical protein
LKSWDWLYWTPQLGAIFFMISSYIQMVEIQGSWWKPKVASLGWHSAVWNLIGALGFLLSAIFGYFEYPAALGQVRTSSYSGLTVTSLNVTAFRVTTSRCSTVLYYDVMLNCTNCIQERYCVASYCCSCCVTMYLLYL